MKLIFIGKLIFFIPKYTNIGDNIINKMMIKFINIYFHINKFFLKNIF